MSLSLLILILGSLLVVIYLLLSQRQNQSQLRETALQSERRLQADFAEFRQEFSQISRQNREELSGAIQRLTETLIQSIGQLSQMQKNQLDTFSQQLVHLTQSNLQKLEALRETLENRLAILQQENSKKLDEMRQTVDEKLHATLEKRLGESFAQVTERLEKVHQGLGEMQVLASGVGDLKKVLTNVKVRGVWGEIQLGNLLEEILTPDQYGKNVKVRPDSTGYVEFAVKFPGYGETPLWLPIDSKFPQDAYQQLLEAQEQANPEMSVLMGKQLEDRIKQSAKDIAEKYISPPYTTDFGVLFLPIEGLYAEVLRRPGLMEHLQHRYRVTVAGPTTISAILNSFRMGFRTLQIEKRSADVWNVLGQVKTEFGKFGDLLDKTQKKLQEAGNTIEDAARKSRTIERHLRGVETPVAEAPLPLEILSN